ncbi:MAG: Asp-tRNA(Asn)/Glu-tRNA(Gln) amidotransferase subunit GatC [Desulfobacteraceae bacterium]|nr:Asp-tRNA(Asn)/Glu-tRNA(Gln) amidotransferase subunit GatC [Desulfobacteraceae bacterium]
MKITPEQVIHVANLARLRVDPQAVEKLARQMATILDYVDTLGQVDTQQVPPTFHAIGLTNAFRDDTPQAHLPRERSLANAPAQEEGGFVVPKVI